LALGESFVCLRCSRPGCSYIQGHNGIDLVIRTLDAVKVKVKKIDGGDLAAPNCACQLGSGFEMDRADFLGRFVIVLATAKESTNENRDYA